MQMENIRLGITLMGHCNNQLAQLIADRFAKRDHHFC